VGHHGLLLLVFREHYCYHLSYANANSYTDAYTNSERHANADTPASNSYPDAERHSNAESNAGSAQRNYRGKSHYFHAAGEPQL
jgi:hypothetical protein